MGFKHEPVNEMLYLSSAEVDGGHGGRVQAIGGHVFSKDVERHRRQPNEIGQENHGADQVQMTQQFSSVSRPMLTQSWFGLMEPKVDYHKHKLLLANKNRFQIQSVTLITKSWRISYRKFIVNIRLEIKSSRISSRNLMVKYDKTWFPT